ncbi:MAG TPA: hypothetical protein VFI24_04530 [Pyrinomonadaceae bacterium]|nr:hypothetical protein [Pyrinomonadaceae bacterium]
MILAVDEADKCPIPLARLIRSIVTHTQQQGVKRVRFIVSGVSPFYQQMVEEDPGVSRFIYKTLTLPPLEVEDAADLLQTKLSLVVKSAREQQIDLETDPNIIKHIIDLSGGHPHIIQLLGSHIIENESEDPDGRLDSRDLANTLRRICYEDRARVYDATIHMLDLYDMLDPFLTLLDLIPRGFPSRLSRQKALKSVTREQVQWLVDHNVLSTQVSEHYSLVDEFLRIRFIIDQAETPIKERELEKHILKIQDMKQDEFTYGDSFYPHYDYDDDE